MLFYDFEVFKFDWLVVVMDTAEKKKHVIINDPEALKQLYEAHVNDIWTGFNSRSYDQYILKGILCGFDPKRINDYIIVKKKKGWQFSSTFRSIPLNNFDVMPNPPVGLKTLEAFMGSDIRETEVPFNIDRKLTPKEIDQTVFYCTHDVEQTMEVFIKRKEQFEAMLTLVKQFKLPISDLGKTEAAITAKILECDYTERTDEFDFILEDYQQIHKYTDVFDWFKAQKTNEQVDPKEFYSRKLQRIVAGVQHTFGWGGIHGAREKYKFTSGHGRQCWHVDVTSYYPSYLIAHNRITRSARHPERYSWAYFYQIDLKHQGRKAERLPYKKMLNALSGAMKDRYNPAYDPCMNNTMVVNCQISALMLIEMLEVIPGFELVQSNTDGLIVTIPDTDEAFNQMDDICYEWEKRCSSDKASIKLEFDEIEWLYQKDVNNYIFKFGHSNKIERKGAWLKELSPIDFDMPILNTALYNYFVKGIPVEDTINQTDELKQFQKIVKLSDKFEWVEWGGKQYSMKSYRVFASNRPGDGKICACRVSPKTGSREVKKFGNTPDNCFFENGDVNGVRVPQILDKGYYIEEARKRIAEFG